MCRLRERRITSSLRQERQEQRERQHPCSRQQAERERQRGQRRERERGQEPALLFYRKQPGQQQQHFTAQLQQGQGLGHHRGAGCCLWCLCRLRRLSRLEIGLTDSLLTFGETETFESGLTWAA